MENRLRASDIVDNISSHRSAIYISCSYCKIKKYHSVLCWFYCRAHFKERNEKKKKASMGAASNSDL